MYESEQRRALQAAARVRYFINDPSDPLEPGWLTDLAAEPLDENLLRVESCRLLINIDEQVFRLPPDYVIRIAAESPPDRRDWLTVAMQMFIVLTDVHRPYPPAIIVRILANAD